MSVDRRAFLRLAGASAAGAVAAACSPRNALPVRTSPPATTSAPAATTGAAQPPDWNSLRARLSGRLLMPGDAGFGTAAQAFNPLFDNRVPAAVARCSTAEDVQACISAAARRIPVAARGGGHSYGGYSVPHSGLVVDLGPMSTVDVQGDRVVIGAGARLKDVYTVLGNAGRCLPAGTCPTVGIAGLTLGGGIGVLTRKYGLTCDHLVSAQVVTADGALRTVSADREAGLFWALRGGGGGNFGIVTSFTFATSPAPDVTAFTLRFPAGSADDVLGAWQGWVSAAPRELWSSLVLSSGTPVRCGAGGCFVGAASSLTPLLDDLVARTGARPTSRATREMDYPAAMKYFSGSENRQSFVASSRIVTKPVAADKVTALVSGRSGMDLLIDGLGGTVSDTAPTDTAFWHRDALASIQVYASADAGNHRAVAGSVAEVVSGLGAAGAGGGYVNYIDPDLPDWMNAYYGGNAARLGEVAKTYDPDGVFRFAQGITA